MAIVGQHVALDGATVRAALDPVRDGRVFGRLRGRTAGVGAGPEQRLLGGRSRRRAVPGACERTGRRATGQGDMVVEGAVDHQRRNGRCRQRLVPEDGADHRCDRGEAVRQTDAERVRHHRAVRHAGGVDALRIDGVAARQRVDEGADEADVIDIVVHRIAAAMPGVPGQQDAVATARAFGIDDDESLLHGLRREAGHAFGDHGIASAAVQHDHERHRFARGPDRVGHAHDVAATQAVVDEEVAIGILAERSPRTGVGHGHERAECERRDDEQETETSGTGRGRGHRGIPRFARGARSMWKKRVATRRAAATRKPHRQLMTLP